MKYQVLVTCTRCNGTGHIEIKPGLFFPNVTTAGTASITCPNCGGGGMIARFADDGQDIDWMQMAHKHAEMVGEPLGKFIGEQWRRSLDEKEAELAALRVKLAQAVAALEFYADKRNWALKDHALTEIEKDFGGERARAALAAVKNG